MRTLATSHLSSDKVKDLNLVPWVGKYMPDPKDMDKAMSLVRFFKLLKLYRIIPKTEYDRWE